MIYLEKQNLTFWQPKGKIELSNIVRELEKFVEIEKTKPPFNRFTDFSHSDVSGIRFDEIKQIYWLRKTEYNGPQVKSVFYVVTDLQFGVVRMYQALMTSTPIEVEIYKTKSQCSLVLGISEEILFGLTDPDYP